MFLTNVHMRYARTLMKSALVESHARAILAEFRFYGMFKYTSYGAT